MIEDRMLSYRKDLFQEAGIQVPKTVDEMMAAAKKLNKPEKNQYGFTQRNRAGGSAGFDLLGWLYAYGARVFDDKYVATLDKPEAKQALEAYLEMNKLSAPGSAKSYGEVTKELQTGVAAMGNDVTIITPLLEDPKQSQFAGKFGYAVAPAGPKAPRPMTSSHLLAICALSKQQELAWKFIEWLTAKEQGKDWCFAGGAAFRKSHYENKEIVDKFPMYPLFKEILDRGEPDYVPRIRPSLEIMAKLADEVNAAVVGTKNAEQALKDGNQAINDILKRGGYQK
jgi:multiple sugar transport system substrate-binding protein